MKPYLPVLLATAFAGLATQARADQIKEVSFEGFGIVRYANPAPPNYPLASRNSKVHVTGTVWLDLKDMPETPPPVPSDFTGTVDLNSDALEEQATGFAFYVAGGGIAANTLFGNFAYATGSVTFLDGQLTGLNLYLDRDGSTASLSTSGFAGELGAFYDGPVANWGGTWKLKGAAPEPGAWALMLAGFGLAGAALRLRRRRAQAA